MKIIIKILINFHILSFWAYLEKYVDRYPNKKKKIKDATDAPIPKYIFSSNKKFFEKFPKKKTVSEYTCAFKYVKPSVLNNISILDVSFISLLKFIFPFIDLIFEKTK